MDDDFGGDYSKMDEKDTASSSGRSQGSIFDKFRAPSTPKPAGRPNSSAGNKKCKDASP